MDLFYELKNKYVLSTISLVNYLRHSDPLTRQEFAQRLERTLDGTYTKTIADYDLFSMDSDGKKIELSIGRPIPIRPTTAEKIWLKTVLDDPRIALFLEEEEICTLRLRLADVPSYARYFIRNGSAKQAEAPTEEEIDAFRAVLTAAAEGHSIQYKDHADGEGAIRQSPIRFNKIEYSLLDRLFSLTLCEDDGLVRHKLSRMKDVRCGPRVDLPAQQNDCGAAPPLAAEPVVLRIYNKNSAIERAVMLFSDCRQVSYPTFGKNGELTELELAIEYYQEEEEELIQKIMSFGPRAMVLKTERIRQKIIERIQSAP